MNGRSYMGNRSQIVSVIHSSSNSSTVADADADVVVGWDGSSRYRVSLEKEEEEI